MNIAELLELDRTETRQGVWSKVQFTFSIYPARTTSPAFVQGVQEGLSGNPARLADGLTVVLADWSIDWDGSPFPPSRENLTLLPFEFLVYLVDLIVPDEQRTAS